MGEKGSESVQGGKGREVLMMMNMKKRSQGTTIGNVAGIIVIITIGIGRDLLTVGAGRETLREDRGALKGVLVMTVIVKNPGGAGGTDHGHLPGLVMRSASVLIAASTNTRLVLPYDAPPSP
jgi:hypothetical protein